MFNVIYTPYISNPQIELCWNSSPVAQYDASDYSPEEARDVAKMLDFHIKSGETMSKSGWIEVSLKSVPRCFRINYRNLWRPNYVH